MRNVSLAYRRAVQAQETGEVTDCILVTITHPELEAPIRLNNVGANITSQGNLFLANFLQATIVDEDPDRLPQAKLAVSNIRREYAAALEESLIPCNVLLEIVRPSEPDYVEASVDNLELQNVQGDEMIIQGDLVPADIKDEPGIDYCYTPGYAPGF